MSLRYLRSDCVRNVPILETGSGDETIPEKSAAGAINISGPDTRPETSISHVGSARIHFCNANMVLIRTQFPDIQFQASLLAIDSHGSRGILCRVRDDILEFSLTSVWTPRSYFVNRPCLNDPIGVLGNIGQGSKVGLEKVSIDPVQCVGGLVDRVATFTVRWRIEPEVLEGIKPAEIQDKLLWTYQLPAREQA